MVWRDPCIPFYNSVVVMSIDCLSKNREQLCFISLLYVLMRLPKDYKNFDIFSWLWKGSTQYTCQMYRWLFQMQSKHQISKHNFSKFMCLVPDNHTNYLYYEHQSNKISSGALSGISRPKTNTENFVSQIGPTESSSSIAHNVKPSLCVIFLVIKLWWE